MSKRDIVIAGFICGLFVIFTHNFRSVTCQCVRVAPVWFGADRIEESAITAVHKRPWACNFVLEKTFVALKISAPIGQANNYVKWMRKYWFKIDGPETAAVFAIRGFLVVAGSTEDPHGHVAIIVPGPGRVYPPATMDSHIRGIFYPNVVCGSLNDANVSHGDRTIRQTWCASDLKRIEYFVYVGR